MAIINKIFIYPLLFGLRVIYAIIKLFPTRNEIVLISRQSNSETLDYRLIKEAILKEHPDYRVTVLCKKLDNKLMYIFHMFKQMYHVARSKVVILDSYCIIVSVLKHKKSLKVIQIWHAIGSMKKFGYAMIGAGEGSSKSIAEIMCMHKNYDVVLISSMYFKKDFIEGFNIDEALIREIPLPRVDLLLDKKYQQAKKEELIKNNPKLKEKKNILYCSTFRKGKNLGNEHIKRLVDCIDFNKYNLLYKPHPLNNIKCDDERIISDFESTFDALSVADAVICDYSSMIYEIGLLKKPLYLYAYDWEEYKEQRELNLDLKKDTGLLFTDDPKKIIEAIEEDNFKNKKWDEFVKKNVTIPKEGCINKIMKLINELL